MRSASLAALAVLLAQVPSAAWAENTHVPVIRPQAPAGAPATAAPTAGPPFSAAVLAGDTLYISGATDTDPATGKAFADPKAGAKALLDGLSHTLARAGMTMDDLVWVQIFATDLGNYAAFNEVYRTYFKGPLPARAFLGAGSLLNHANFEIMGIAVKPPK
ncbi:MAG: RidA family protein [Sphingomonadales bacterium]|nr:RidA family protein [Sphingomonadales bacterium]